MKVSKALKSISALTILIFSFSLIPANLAFATNTTQFFTYENAPETIVAKSKNPKIGVEDNEGLTFHSTTTVPNESKTGIYDLSTRKLVEEGIVLTKDQDTSFDLQDYIPSGDHYYQMVQSNVPFGSTIPANLDNLTSVVSKSNIVTLTRDPLLTSLTSDNPDYEQMYGPTINWTINQKLNGTQARVYLFDTTSNHVIYSANYDYGVEVSYSFGSSHTYQAFVGIPKDGLLIEDVVSLEDLDILETPSNIVAVARKPWSVYIAPSLFGEDKISIETQFGGGEYSTYLVERATGAIIWDSNSSIPYYAVDNTGHAQDKGWVKAYVAKAYTHPFGASPNPNIPFPMGTPFTNLSQLEDIQATSDGYSKQTSGGISTPGEISGGSNPSEACGQSCHGDPVNTFTGEFFENDLDITFPGSHLIPAITRSFSTLKRNEDNLLGKGWRTNYEMKLISDTADTLSLTNQVKIIQENGSETTFYKHDNGVYESADRTTATLVKESNGQFVFTRDRNLVFTFNASGQLISIAKASSVITLAYANNKLSTISDTKNNVLTYGYNTAGLLASITSNNGQNVAYQYDTKKRLIKATDASGTIHNYTYDTNNRVSTLTNALGGVTTNTYNSDHKVVTQKDPLNNIMKFAYNENTTTITYPDTSKIVESYSAQGQLIKRTETLGSSSRSWSYSYDGHGNKISVVNPDMTYSTILYDVNNNPVLTTDENGNTTKMSYDAHNNLTQVTNALNQSVVNTYDTQDNLTSTTDPLAYKISFTYDSDNKVVSAIDGRGNEVGVSPSDYTSTFTYTQKGLTEYTINADGAKTRKEYDSVGNTIKLTTPKGFAVGSNPDDYATTIEYNALGLPTKTTDPYHNETAVTYDAMGNILTSIAPDNTTTAYTYDVMGKLLTKVNAKNAVISYSYDNMGRLVKITDANLKEASIKYDSFGRVSETVNALNYSTKQQWDKNDNLISSIDAKNNKTVYKNDLMGNPVAITTPSGAISRYAYDKLNRVIKTTDPENKVTKTEYTTNGKISKVIAPDNTATLYTYDAGGNLLTETNALGAVQQWSYDNLSRKIAYTDAENQQTTYTYNLDGTIASSTQAGKLTTYVYDRINRLTKIDHEGTDSDIVYTYDVNSDKATEQKGNDPVVSYSYDELGNMTARGPPNASILYEYNNLDQVSKMTMANGRQINYTYDAIGNLNTINTAALGTVQYVHNELGNTTTTSYPNGIKETNAYDNEQRLIDVELTKNSTSLYKKTQSYSLSGNIKQRNNPGTTPNAPKLEDFVYDPLNRLTNQKLASDASSVNAYEYNAVGDLTKLNNATQTFDLTGKILTSGSKKFDYDVSGNRIADKQITDPSANTTTYGWSTTNQLTSVTQMDSTSSVSYSYDVQGLLNSRTENSNTTAFSWDTQNSIPLMLSDGTYDYVYGEGNTPLAQIKLSDNSITYLHSDLNGSVTASTNANGSLVGTTDYSPYGAVQGASVSRFGYAGEWTDPSTHFVYLRARWLDTSTGTFLSLDPISQMSGQAYGYTKGNPLQQTDPFGLFALNPIDWVKSQIINPIGEQIDSGFNKITDGVGKAGKWIYQNSDTISSVTSIASIILTFIPGGQPVAIVLAGVSVFTGGMAVHKEVAKCWEHKTDCNPGNIAINTVATFTGVAAPLVRGSSSLARLLGDAINMENLSVVSALTGLATTGLNIGFDKINESTKGKLCD